MFVSLLAMRAVPAAFVLGFAVAAGAATSSSHRAPPRALLAAELAHVRELLASERSAHDALLGARDALLASERSARDALLLASERNARDALASERSARDALLGARDALLLASERSARDAVANRDALLVSERDSREHERGKREHERELLMNRLATKSRELDVTAGRLDVRSVLEEIARVVDAKRSTSAVFVALAAGTLEPEFAAYLARVAVFYSVSLHHLKTEGGGAFSTLSSNVHHPRVAGGAPLSLPANIFANRHVLIFVSALFRYFERDISFYAGSPAEPLEPLPPP